MNLKAMKFLAIARMKREKENNKCKVNVDSSLHCAL